MHGTASQRIRRGYSGLAISNATNTIPGKSHDPTETRAHRIHTIPHTRHPDEPASCTALVHRTEPDDPARIPSCSTDRSPFQAHYYMATWNTDSGEVPGAMTAVPQKARLNWLDASKCQQTSFHNNSSLMSQRCLIRTKHRFSQRRRAAPPNSSTG